MVHRPADSRLLTNLYSHEKDYSKYLIHLLEHSQVSLASFSAYASASSPALSNVIGTVAGALAGADDALRKYAASLEGWQSQLKVLIDLEDEVGNIVRDREILVTRLIKASKQHKHSRDSFLGSSGSASSLSFSKPEVPIGPKLGAAQTELQACEAHLAMKERELESLRTTAIQSGLQMRCKAMVECGWTWGEMGKEGLRALESLGKSSGELPNGHGVQPYASSLNPLPGFSHQSDSGHAPSDLSSIAPSQSASQIALPGSVEGTSGGSSDAWRSPPPNRAPTPPRGYLLHIPPAHAIEDSAVPNGRPRPQWRISEVEEPEEEVGGSSEEEDEQAKPVEVHENERFTSKGRGNGKAVASAANGVPRAFSIRTRQGSEDSSGHVHFPSAPPLTSNPSSQSSKERHKGGSVSLFARSIAALFHHKDKSGPAAEERPPPPSSAPRRWQTRTDKHLAKSRKGDDSSDDEQGARSEVAQPYSTWSPVYVPKRRATSLVPSPSDPTASNATQRLKKKTKRSSAEARSNLHADGDTDRERTSDSGNAKKSAPSTRRRDGSADSRRSKTNTQAVQSTTLRNTTVPMNNKNRAPPEAPSTGTSGAQNSLSRSSSFSKQSALSSASAHTLTRSPTMPAPSSSTRTVHPSTPTRRRTTSIDVSDTASLPIQSTHANTHKRGSSVSSVHRSGLTRDGDGPSLMSIVEGVTKQNKEAWAKQDPNRMLVLPKAPPPVSVSLDMEEIRKPSLNGGGEPSKVVVPSPSYDQAHISPSASAPSLPLSATRPPARMPLRSALRNSRTPSPNPQGAAIGSPVYTALDLAVSTLGPSIDRNTGAAPAAGAVHNKDNDTVSISSYETGNEEFEDAESAPPPPPPHDEKPLATAGSDLSHSTASTASPPTRRKSVRMSLPPTFSTTPPAFDDDDEGGNKAGRGRHHPWAPSSTLPGPSPASSGWTTRIDQDGTKDLWQDSSDEDEEYRTAKRLLTRGTKAGR